MNGAAKYPPGEAPEAEARAEAELDRELRSDAAPLDIAVDEPEAEPASLARGAQAIKEFWRHAPLGPGVYRMIGEEGEVLYVGKARSIKKRIAAYMAPERQPSRIARMVSQTRSMVFVTTETEAEALLLEANLVRQLRPRYNVVLRDDKSFPYIHIATGHPAARIVKHRGARNAPGDYFGPFASAGAVFRTLNALQRAFLLRTCADSYYENRTRPCLLYQIKRCSGPCTGEIRLDEYAELVKQARDFLSGRSRAVRQRLAEEMRQASAALEFEKAARLRDRISALSAIQGEQSVNPRSIFGSRRFSRSPRRRGSFASRCSFSAPTRTGAIAPTFRAADRAMGPEEVLDAFLAQFYLERPAPRLVLLSHAVPSAGTLCEVLSARAGHRIAIGAPGRGEKRDLVDAAMRNAREALSRKLAEAASQEKLLAALQAAFGVDGPIRRVEVYDNSHIMGTNAIGAMVVAGPDGFVKNQYRTFNIRSADLTPGDDYAMMREVLTRRFARLLRQGETAEEGAFPDTPDLIIIDGGRGQFEAAREVLAALGVNGLALASIAKGPDRNAGRETFFVEGREPFRLSPRDPALFLRPAPARRGASLRHRDPSGAAEARVRQEPARRNPRHRPDAQARPAERLRLRQACGASGPGGPGKDAGLERRDGEGCVRLLP